jgi:hypothetical protein
VAPRPSHPILALLVASLLAGGSAAADQGTVGFRLGASEFALYSTVMTVSSERGLPSLSLFLGPDGSGQPVLTMRVASIVAHEDLDGDGYYVPGEEGPKLIAKGWELTGPAAEGAAGSMVVQASLATSLDLIRTGPPGPVLDFASVEIALSLADHERTIGGAAVGAESDVKVDIRIRVAKPGVASGVAIDLALSEAPGGEEGRAVAVPGAKGDVLVRSGTPSAPTAIPAPGLSERIDFVSGDQGSHAYFDWLSSASSDIGDQDVQASVWSQGGSLHLALAYPVGDVAIDLEHDPVLGINVDSPLVRDALRGAAETIERNLHWFAAGAAIGAVALAAMLAGAGRRSVPVHVLRRRSGAGRGSGGPSRLSG